MTEVLAHQPRPQGPKLAIVTNAGGPGVIATDALLTLGGELAEISTATTEALNKVLPPHWSHNNPIDIIGDAGPERFEKTVEIVAKDPNADGLLVIMTPQGMTNPALIAEKLTRFAKLDGKPILASWMGGAEAAQGEAMLNRAGIPTFPFPDTAVRAFPLHVEVQLQPARAVRNAGAAGFGRDPTRRRPREVIDACAREGRSRNPDRVRIEAGAEGLRHSGGGDQACRRARRKR